MGAYFDRQSRRAKRSSHTLTTMGSTKGPNSASALTDQRPLVSVAAPQGVPATLTDRRPTLVIQGMGTPSAVGPVLQRVTIKGSPTGDTLPKDTLTITDVEKFKKHPLYKTMIEPAIARYPRERVDHFLTILVQQGAVYYNGQQFLDALIHDIKTKSMDGHEPTLQERYMTKRGWGERAAGNIRSHPRGPTGPLKIYRTMSIGEWQALQSKEGKGALGAHLGDFKQANEYLYGKSQEKVLVEFTLKPDAECALFNSEVLALPEEAANGSAPKLIETALKREGDSGSFQVASQNEGTRADMIGIKQEDAESGFSLGIANARSSQLFLSMVDRMRVIGWSDGTTDSVRSATAGTLDLRREQARYQSRRTVEEEKSMPKTTEKEKKAEIEIAKGIAFDVLDPRIRHDGLCLWDTLIRVYGMDRKALIDAAAEIGCSYGDYVWNDTVWQIVRGAGGTGLTLITWPYGNPREATTTVYGNGSIVIGLAHDPEGQGHYIPPVEPPTRK